MINSNSSLASLGNEQLLAATRGILRRACVVEADLLVHLAEIEERGLHLEMAFPSMFAFCVTKLGFSEDALVLDRGKVVHRSSSRSLLDDPGTLDRLLGVA